MAIFLVEVENWFRERPRWLQDATRRVLQNELLNKTDIEELVALCKAEVGIADAAHRDLKAVGISKGTLRGSQKSSSLRLEQINELQGINALQPRGSLNFGEKQLTIVYGQNGTGKSGYIRALKHACGSRSPGLLHGNVFSSTSIEQSCRFKYAIDGILKESVWCFSKGAVDELRAVQIYDTNSAQIYVNEENEVAFEPSLLKLFTTLTRLCDLVNGRLEAEITAKQSKKPSIPFEFQATNGASWFEHLSYRTTTKEIQDKCAWAVESNAELEKLSKRLAETQPTQKALGLRRQKTALMSLQIELENWSARLGDIPCQTYLSLRDEAVLKRNTADVDAQTVFANAPLKGVGSESWKLLWDQARTYSETEAFKGITFPNTNQDASCVLCQQPLTPAARERFESFESFVRGGLETQASAAESKTKAQLESINGIEEEALKLRVEALGVLEETERAAILSFGAALETRRNALISAIGLLDLPPVPNKDLIKFMIDRSQQLEQQALAFDEDAKGQNRPTLDREHKELGAQKWLSQQRASIEAEVIRLREVRQLEDARKLTNTQALSTKKSALADELITGAYIARFQDQLNELCAPHIRVQLIKTRAEKGRVFHKIVLNNSKKVVPALEILSEGEFRIVSLAAFISDVEAREDKGPFIFDDPISSLDQVFEEATAEKLVELANSRQVIVFTHRLSLMSLLEEAAKKSNIETGIVSLRVEKWGIGEPSDTPIHAKKPAKALSDILGRLERAKKVLESSSADYEILAKALCSDFRIIVERIIELTLLSEVVQRFRRSIVTKNKIHLLAKITSADCQLLDNLMTEYSKYEHSQPAETPISAPQPDDLEKDIKRALAWIIEFENR